MATISNQISNDVQLAKVLARCNVLRISILPRPIYGYVHKKRKVPETHVPIRELLKDKKYTYPYIEELACLESDDPIGMAALGGYINILRHMAIFKAGFNWDPQVCHNAAANGHVECLEFMFDRSCPFDKTVARTAIANKKLESLICIHENADNKLLPELNAADLSILAAHTGCVECLQYTHAHKLQWDTSAIILEAAKSGNLECLKFAHAVAVDDHAKFAEKKANDDLIASGAVIIHEDFNSDNKTEESPPPPIWTHDICCWIAAAGHLECLRFARENGAVCDENTAAMAEQFGQEACLEYLTCDT